MVFRSGFLPVNYSFCFHVIKCHVVAMYLITTARARECACLCVKNTVYERRFFVYLGRQTLSSFFHLLPSLCSRVLLYLSFPKLLFVWFR